MEPNGDMLAHCHRILQVFLTMLLASKVTSFKELALHTIIYALQYLCSLIWQWWESAMTIF